MKKKFAAFLREENSLRELAIADAGKPAIDQAFIERWQGVFNLVALESGEPVVLILRVTQDSLSVLLQSDHTDQNTIEYYLKNGIYCASALGKSGLLIANRASGDPQAGDPIKLPSITACFGLPVQWPDEALFGVVCVLNNPGKTLKPAYRNVLSGLKSMLEQELAALQDRQQLPQAPKTEALASDDNRKVEPELVILQKQNPLPQTSETDALTSIYSRKKIEDILKHEFERAKRYFKTFTVTIIDLNGLQKIGEAFGNEVGDDILKAFAQSVGSKIRETDSWGRWSCDAFILVCPYADTVETQQMFTRIKPLVVREMKAIEAFSDFSFGVSQYEPEDLTYQAIVKRAEENMYQYKEMARRKSFVAADEKNAGIR